jgi:molybdopterin converting factor small subunit
MITVEVRFFGDRQQFTRRIDAQVERDLPRVVLPDAATVDDLLALLGISTGEDRPLVSINRFYHRDNVPLTDGDRVQLMKTVVGG